MQLVCTFCKAGLKLANAVAPGAKVRCPKCKQIFAAPTPAAEPEVLSLDDDDEVPAPPTPPPPPPAVRKPTPAPPPPPATPAPAAPAAAPASGSPFDFDASDPEPPRPQSRSRSRRDDDDDDDDRPPARRYQRGTSSGSSLVLWGSIGLFVVVVGTVSVLFATGMFDNKPEETVTDSGDGDGKPKDNPKGVIGPDNWADTDVPEEGFSADFPGVPTRGSEVEGGEEVVHYTVRLPFGEYVLTHTQVSKMDLPKGTEDFLLDTAAEQLKGESGTVKKFQFAGKHPAIEISDPDIIYDDDAPATLRVQCIIANKQMFTLIVITKKDAPAGAIDTERFFNSFELVPKK